MTAQSVAPRRMMMTTFTIDSDNNITAFGSKEEAAANDSTALIFTSQKELNKYSREASSAEFLTALLCSA
jgi:hypothetical protein